MFSKTLARTGSVSSLHSAESSQHHSVSKHRLPTLPKLELAKFDGNVKSWMMFWGQFKKVHEDADIDPCDKFQYLLQSMTPNSSARHLVESYPPCAENYVKAVEALKARFARDDVLIETYVRGLLTLMQRKEEVRNLPVLYDDLQSHLQALDTLGVTKDKYASMLFPMIESALPEDVLRAWHRSQPNTRDLSKLMEFLRQEVESEERIRLARSELDVNTLAEPKPPTACFMAESKRDKEGSKKQTGTLCVWCDKENHSPVECYKAAKMTLKERTEIIKSKKACSICLKSNHIAKKCKSFPKCLFCKKRHFTIMCAEMAGNSVNTKLEPDASSNLSCQQKQTTTLLQTLVVKIVHDKKEVYVRALIDSGAQRSYIKKDLVEKLGIKPTTKEVMNLCLFGGFETKKEECQIFDICVKNIENNFCVNLSVVEQTNICGFLPKLSSSVILRQLHQYGVTITDSTDSPDDVSLLIGADFCGLILTGDIVQLENNLTAIKTKLGWTVQGTITGVYSSVANMTTTLHCLTKIDLTDLWTLEALGITDPAVQATKSARDLEILKTFQENIKINDEGRYEVCLPWRDVPRPQSNYDLAKKRMESTSHRLEKIGKINDYDRVFREWLELNIIEKAPDQSVQGHYMPHHAVIKESSLTTKIRPVFDGSAKDRNGISLNSCLEKGVNLLERIPNILINFRKNKIGVTSDIAKAFLQISLIPEDRDFLRFLWWSNIDDKDRKMVTYRHRRVVFGVTSSPFHLVATINHHLDNCPAHLKATADKLKKSFYVDNCVTSLESEEDMEKFIRESKQLMLSGMFDLRGWVTSPVMVDNNVESISVLGVTWNVKNDTLNCSISYNNLEKLSKRTLLSVAQRVFDPIGVTCPTTIIPKKILQESWSRKLTWDEELPVDLAKEFKRWLEQAHLINDCVISRRLVSAPIKECELSLHVFSDASKDAYSACIFLRSKHGDQVNVSLVLGKSRVTPVNKVTIPRQELIAATLACRLSVTAIKSLDIPNCDVYYWSDSTVVLTWIKCHGPWSVFVTNRVKEIKSLSSTSAWKHVPGHLNPADLPSRGVNPKGFLESRWWEGPAWLRLDKEDWPAAELTHNSKEVDEERKETGTHAMLVEEEGFLNRLTYFSSYTKIVRMMCWMLRFKKRSTSRELTYDEFEYAENCLIRLIQEKYKTTLTNIKHLETFIDANGLMRLNTKLSLGSEDYNFKFPIVLPGAETIVKRLVAWRHIELKHTGAQTLLSSLRQTYWIIGARKLVRNVIHRCVRCMRFKAKRCQAPTGVLPKERMEAGAAFQFTGVDLAGPLMLRSGAKAWIVLFTCATYRAVHLEVVESLSTSEFLMALRRFVARRGRVEQLFSDNATNFRGLDNAFNSLDWDEIRRFSSITRVKWYFLPVNAPWWGGFYERMIGFLKQILCRVLGKASISLVELQTVLCDCEAVINSRPLTYVGGHKDLRPLTPSMFIQPMTSHDVTDFDNIDERTLRQRYCQSLRNDLRKRFRDEYIGSLVQRREQISHKPLQVGDIVILETEGKRVTWPLGTIEELCPGADGITRVVRVRTSAGVRVRPVQRVFSLEMRHDSPVQTLPPADCTIDFNYRLPTDNTNSSDCTMDANIDTRPTRKRRLPQHLFDFVLD